MTSANLTFCISKDRPGANPSRVTRCCHPTGCHNEAQCTAWRTHSWACALRTPSGLTSVPLNSRPTDHEIKRKNPWVDASRQESEFYYSFRTIKNLSRDHTPALHHFLCLLCLSHERADQPRLKSLSSLKFFPPGKHLPSFPEDG